MRLRHSVSTLLESWEANAGAWTAAVRAGAIESRRIATDAAILNAVRACTPRRVLDLGCGEGWLLRALADEGVEGVGVDGAAALVVAAEAAGGGRFLRMTYDEIAADPLRCGRNFDAVVANFALLDEDLAQLLAALRRVLMPKGRLIVQTLHPLAAGPPYADGWRTEDFRGFGDAQSGDWTPMPWYFRTVESWLALLETAGYELERRSEPAHLEDGRPLSLLLVARAGG